MNLYKISIIIPNYNGGKFLSWCLESILAQDYDNYEVIIVDWKSTDRSHEIIKEYMRISDKIQWLKIVDNWISHGFNIGITESSWDFILLLGSDDYLYSWILNKFITYTNQILSFGLIDKESLNVFCDAVVYWSKDHLMKERKVPRNKLSRSWLIRYGNLVWFQNIFLNQSWVSSNMIDEKLKYAMDYEAYFRMLRDKQIFLYLPEKLTINYHGDNTSIRYWYQSGVEANIIAWNNKESIIDFIYIFTRQIALYLLKLRSFIN